MAGLNLTRPHSILAQDNSVTGFKFKEIRFDESLGNAKPTPTIPKGWRFIGVSNGETRNSNHLWFQDNNGDVYLIQGFTVSGEFILNETIQEINVGK